MNEIMPRQSLFTRSAAIARKEARASPARPDRIRWRQKLSSYTREMSPPHSP